MRCLLLRVGIVRVYIGSAELMSGHGNGGRGCETEAVQRINAYADVGAIVGERWTEPHVTGSPTLAAV
mgnify:CR=1 FL=1